MTADSTDGTNGSAIRCLIADDQAMVRESFAAILAAQPVGCQKSAQPVSCSDDQGQS